MDLNESQRTAAEYGIGDSRPHAPLLIIAGAGTGKTKTLAYRVAYLVLNGTDPQRILPLTFTRRAAAEMTRRVTPPSSPCQIMGDVEVAPDLFRCVWVWKVPGGEP
jgi:UvrD-like helicase family protein